MGPAATAIVEAREASRVIVTMIIALTDVFTIFSTSFSYFSGLVLPIIPGQF
jgi:hypothetical protein